MGITAIICVSLVAIVAMILTIAMSMNTIDEIKRLKNDSIRVKLDLDEPIKFSSTVDEEDINKIMRMLPGIYKDMMKSLTEVMNDMD